MSMYWWLVLVVHCFICGGLSYTLAKKGLRVFVWVI